MSDELRIEYWLIHQREKQEYTQEELSSLLGIAPSTLADWEQKKRIPFKSRHIKGLSKVLNIPIAQILNAEYGFDIEIPQDGEGISVFAKKIINLIDSYSPAKQQLIYNMVVLLGESYPDPVPDDFIPPPPHKNKR